jgi:hypothetical protein
MKESSNHRAIYVYRVIQEELGRFFSSQHEKAIWR